MNETITMRGPKNEDERLFCALMSLNEELFESNGRIIVHGKNKEGESIYLGDVSSTAAAQKGVDAMALIERVRFGR